MATIYPIACRLHGLILAFIRFDAPDILSDSQPHRKIGYSAGVKAKLEDTNK
jgi:hypothetical protein